MIRIRRPESVKDSYLWLDDQAPQPKRSYQGVDGIVGEAVEGPHLEEREIRARSEVVRYYQLQEVVEVPIRVPEQRRRSIGPLDP